MEIAARYGRVCLPAGKHTDSGADKRGTGTTPSYFHKWCTHQDHNTHDGHTAYWDLSTNWSHVELKAWDIVQGAYTTVGFDPKYV